MSSNTVTVTAAPGCRVPRESNPRVYYPAAGEAPEAIERTPHIERLLQTGDLVEVAPVPVPAPAAAKKG